eukprot:Hpha_TRINITY_DN8614_c0_g1::TRINITY_DN8614_c0_g1_i1::g.168833::m.168833
MMRCACWTAVVVCVVLTATATIAGASLGNEGSRLGRGGGSGSGGGGTMLRWSRNLGGRRRHESFPTPPGTAVLVLGHALSDDGSPPRALRERVRVAASLWKSSNGTLPIIAVGGEAVRDRSEAEVIADLLAKADVPRDVIHVEAASKNTIENAINAIPLLHELRISNIALVTNDFHMPRASMIFEAVFHAHRDEGTELKVLRMAAPSGHSLALVLREPRPWKKKIPVEEWTRAERAEYDYGLLHATPSWLGSYGVDFPPPFDTKFNGAVRQLITMMPRAPPTASPVRTSFQWEEDSD